MISIIVVNGSMTEDIIRKIEEIAEQVKALKGMKEMAAIYGYDISKPAKNAIRHSNGYTLDT